MMEMSYADDLKEQGKEQGREEGRTGGLRSALETFLITRFGTLPDNVRQAINAADQDKINTWIQTVATAKTLNEVGILTPQ